MRGLSPELLNSGHPSSNVAARKLKKSAPEFERAYFKVEPQLHIELFLMQRRVWFDDDALACQLLKIVQPAGIVRLEFFGDLRIDAQQHLAAFQVTAHFLH